MSSLPMQTVCVLIYACTTYWFTGQPLEWQRFFAFSWILIEISYVAMCLGFLNGSIFNVKNGVIFGPFFITPFLIFSGFLLRMADTPSYVHWLFHISFLKHGLVGLSLSIFGTDRAKLECEKVYCHYRNPRQFLKDVGVESDHYYIAVAALALIAAVVITSAYLILKYRLKKKW
ncbi:ATP-binding cassette sub-family G member 4 [Eumeta japonica]|uniref:ATP-binding cassette sub-family G member 4 n=1 Tax=Eumeta variegata TaxID=151549 RepID=A0A4C2A6U8_EUMVA|nr:ATP-binding cassette sub-family G member 4 [Eumeta japonica]